MHSFRVGDCVKLNRFSTDVYIVIQLKEDYLVVGTKRNCGKFSFATPKFEEAVFVNSVKVFEGATVLHKESGMHAVIKK